MKICMDTPKASGKLERNKLQAGDKGKVFFWIIFVGQQMNFQPIFVDSWTLCCWPRKGSNFYPTVTLAWLD